MGPAVGEVGRLLTMFLRCQGRQGADGIMWAFVILGVLLALLVGCWSMELGVVTCLVAGLWYLCGRDHTTGTTGTTGTTTGKAPSSASSSTASARRAMVPRAARMATNVEEEKRSRRPRPPVVREPTVQRVPLAAVMEEHPSENVLDAALTAQRYKRGLEPDLQRYYGSALPSTLQRMARELTATADPSIVPLTGAETYPRSLGAC